jgi:hypothetical protein
VFDSRSGHHEPENPATTNTVAGFSSRGEADLLRILFRIVTIVSIVKFVANLLGRRRGGDR